MKKVRIPLRLMKQVKEEKAFWIHTNHAKDLGLEIGDDVGFQHPACYESQGVYHHGVVTGLTEEQTEDGNLTRVEFA